MRCHQRLQDVILFKCLSTKAVSTTRDAVCIHEAENFAGQLTGRRPHIERRSFFVIDMQMPCSVVIVVLFQEK